MVQYGLPISDNDEFGWTEGAGDSDVDQFDELDEGFGAGRGSGSGPDDSTTYWQTDNESSNSLRCNIQTITDPAVSTGHVTRVRCQKNVSGGRQLDLTFFLNDPDQIFSDSTNSDIGSSWTTFIHNLTGGEADTIDNYATLDINTQILDFGGGTPRIGYCSTQEFECPDVVADREVLHRPKLSESLLTHGLGH